MTYDMLAEIAAARAEQEAKPEPDAIKPITISPFEFAETASHSKKNIIASADQPDIVEEQYNPFVVNRSFALHADSVLYANEMNMRWELFKGAQYMYYLTSLRARKRFAKWPKLEKDADLDLIQEVYQCNRVIAKQYRSILTEENLKSLNSIRAKGGSSK